MASYAAPAPPVAAPPAPLWPGYAAGHAQQPYYPGYAGYPYAPPPSYGYSYAHPPPPHSAASAPAAPTAQPPPPPPSAPPGSTSAPAAPPPPPSVPQNEIAPPPPGTAAPSTETCAGKNDAEGTTGAAVGPNPAVAAPAAPQAYDPAAYQQYYAGHYAAYGYGYGQQYAYPPAPAYGAAYPAPPQAPYPYASAPGHVASTVSNPTAAATAPASYPGYPSQQASTQQHASKPGAGTGANKTPLVIKPQIPGVRFPNQPAATRAWPNNAQAGTLPTQAATQPAPSYPHTQPAYVRVTSGATTNTAQATTAKPGPGGKSFPPAFSSWVERCFERCKSNEDRQTMTAKLMARIKVVEAQARMWLIDWDKEPAMSAKEDDTPKADSEREHDRFGYTSPTGLRSKRSRWEETQDEDDYHSKRKDDGSAYRQHEQQFQSNTFQNQNKKQRKQMLDLKDDNNHRKHASVSNDWSRREEAKRSQRAGRFGDGQAVGGIQRVGGRYNRRFYEEDDMDMDGSDDFDAASIVIVGTCQTLEKSYFRLTSAPDPSVVRPAPVLKKALDKLVGLLHEGSVNYFYACDQFKGMRQDCTVQHLKNELAAQIYEAHARAALEYGDMAEFNQCQTQLAAMYSDGIKGCVEEFTAYKVLYNTAHARAGAKNALLHTLRTALAHQRSQPACSIAADNAVNVALRAREAAFVENYPAFFQAYSECPALGRALLDVVAPHFRWLALNALVKVYKASLPVSFVARWLGFFVKDACKHEEAAGKLPLPGCREAFYAGKAAALLSEEEAVAACCTWLQAHGAVLEATDSDAPQLDVKSSLGKLFIPEEPKVSHGDENLSLEDFLARASGLA